MISQDPQGNIWSKTEGSHRTVAMEQGLLPRHHLRQQPGRVWITPPSAQAPGKLGPWSHSAAETPRTWSLSGLGFLVCKVKCRTSWALLRDVTLQVHLRASPCRLRLASAPAFRPPAPMTTHLSGYWQWGKRWHWFWFSQNIWQPFGNLTMKRNWLPSATGNKLRTNLAEITTQKPYRNGHQEGGD